MSKEVKVEELPLCDICNMRGIKTLAHYDVKTINGPWAYMCEIHFKSQGIGLGTGKGQKLVVK